MVPGSIAVDLFFQLSLGLKSELLIQADRPFVKGEDPEIHFMQIHLEKSIIQQQLKSFPTQALPPGIFIPEIDDALGVPIFNIDVRQGGDSDRLVRILLFNDIAFGIVSFGGRTSPYRNR